MDQTTDAIKEEKAEIAKKKEITYSSIELKEKEIINAFDKLGSMGAHPMLTSSIGKLAHELKIKFIEFADETRLLTQSNTKENTSL